MKNIGNYRMDALLGEGGMGAVYRAYDLALHREVAIKLIHEQYARRPIFRERFIQEARVMASLNHPGIVQVYHLGIEGDLLYIPMEFIPGGNLRQLLDDLISKNQWLPLHEAIRLVEQLCQTLEYAHQHKVLHRDIKPANLMIKHEPSKGLPFRLILTDLGLAKILEGQGLTQAGTTVGTPAYMSPEQASGLETDPRSDVYSLGILLYELAVGRLPFPIRSITEAVRYHTQEPPPPPRSLRPELPEAVERVILKSLAKDPNQRYASAAGFGIVLAGAMDVSIADIDRTDHEGLSLATVYDTSVMTASKPTPTMREAGSLPPRGGTVLNAPADALQGGTVLDGGSMPSRGGSVFAGQSISPNSMSRIQVVHKEHTAEVFPLPLGTVTIGRGSDNDIPLSDPKASQRHAQISWDGREYRVLDLNSTNGTYMGRNKLLPGMPEVWRGDQQLRIGDTWLRLLLPTAEYPGASGFTSKVSSTSVYTSSSAGVVAVAVNPQQLAMDAGGSVSVTLSLLNQSPQVDHFSISLTGIPSHWILNLPAQVELMPGAPTETAFTLHIPRAPQSRAGRQLLTIRVTSQRDPSQFAEVKFTLTIAPYSQFKAELQPQRLRSGQVGHLTIANQSNLQETFMVTFTDDLEELSFQPPQLQVKIPEGQSSSVEYRAEPRQLRFLGSEKSHPFQSQVSLPNGQPQILRTTLLSRAIFPAWVPATILPLCLLFVGVVAALVSKIPIPTPTLIPGSEATLTPSAIPDSRGPMIDEWCVYLSDQPPATFTSCPVQVKALPGQILIIHWRVSNATELMIDPIGNQALSGDIPYKVTTSTTQISLSANNAENKKNQKTTQIILIVPSVTLTIPAPTTAVPPTTSIPPTTAVPPTTTVPTTAIPTTVVPPTTPAPQIIELSQTDGGASAWFGEGNAYINVGQGQSFLVKQTAKIKEFSILLTVVAGQGDPATDLIICDLRNASMAVIQSSSNNGFSSGGRWETFAFNIKVNPGIYIFTCYLRNSYTLKAHTYGIEGNVNDNSYLDGTRYVSTGGHPEDGSTWSPEVWDLKFIIKMEVQP